MKVTMLMAVTLAVLLLTTAALPDSKGAKSSSIAGEWHAVFHIVGNSTPFEFTFKVSGTTVSGTVQSGHTGPGTIQDGTWTNDELRATLVFEKHDSIALTGKLKDGQLTGDFHTEGHQGTWEATRSGSART